MTVNPTINHHLLLENRLNQLLRDKQLSKDVWRDLMDCLKLQSKLEFKKLNIINNNVTLDASDNVNYRPEINPADLCYVKK